MNLSVLRRALMAAVVVAPVVFTLAVTQASVPATKVATLVPAQTATFDFTWGTGARHNAAIGSTVLIDTIPVPVELSGLDCDVSGTVSATPSTHPGNTLRVATNGTTVDVVGVEDVADRTLTWSGTATLADVITFAVVLGDGDGKANQTTSVHGTGAAICSVPPPPTTDPPTSVSTSAPPTSVPETSSPPSESTSTTAPATTSSPSSTPTSTSPPPSSEPETTTEPPSPTPVETTTSQPPPVSSSTSSAPPSVVRVPTTQPPDDCPPGFEDGMPSTPECDVRFPTGVESG